MMKYDKKRSKISKVNEICESKLPEMENYGKFDAHVS